MNQVCARRNLALPSSNHRFSFAEVQLCPCQIIALASQKLGLGFAKTSLSGSLLGRTAKLRKQD
ncbi:hypothetical protein EIKCOROL_02185 [Eikenella corrodens ATCC 23834]|uniref:Uncharacterized protein n=1 Tax=Eikenella corrodens ATCC 23834 TaxID=546274 RepID=C0DXS4_EIKCO|nr:hypothetical protein EIKCOROL_02185 [Eikenella corrodens ATCC 23834]